MRLKGKVAIVTGAGSGIGAKVALEFALEGANVCCADLDTSGAQSIADAIIKEKGDGSAIAIKMDVTQNSEVESAVAQVHKKWGKIDVLVNNAGILYMKDFLDHTEEIWDKTMAVNVKGHFLCGCATNLWIKYSSSSPVLPEILPTVAQKTAPEGYNAVGALDCPVHA